MYKTYNPKRDGNVIYVYDNDINKALNQLKHMSAPLMKELKLKRYFESNTAKRQRKMKEAISRERIRQRKYDLYN